MSTLIRTCRREAPIVRSVANSRVRWATVIEIEFAITNAPTKSAIPPKASRNDWRMLRNDFVSLASDSACASPVRTCVCGGRIVRIWLTNCCSETPGLDATRI